MFNIKKVGCLCLLGAFCNRLMLLKKGEAVQKDYAMYLRLYGDIVLDKPITPHQYTYERENCDDQNELLYYTEIQDLLNLYREQNHD